MIKIEIWKEYTINSNSEQLQNMDTFYGVYGNCVKTVSDVKNREVLDALWLSEKTIDFMHNTMINVISHMNNAFDLEQGIINAHEFNCFHNFTFLEKLYQLYMFIDGHLLGMPLCIKTNYRYFANMHHVVKQLCIRGVYVVEGVEPVRRLTASQCSVVVLVKDDLTVSFNKMLDTIHKEDINIYGRQIKQSTVVCKRDLVCGWSTPNMLKIPTTYLINHFNNNCFDSHSVWHLRLWNHRKENIVHVEDMLLHCWVKFNSFYGHLNIS